MKEYRIRGLWYTVKANCMKEAIRRLVDGDMELTYKHHWYTKSNRKAWAEVETNYGYKCIVEEV